MAIFESIKSGFSCAVETVTDVTHSLIEKNRTNAQLNRLRSIMKSECEMINRAYITLGKKYYENKQNGKTDICENEEELFKIIAESKAHIKKIRERYRQVLERQTVEIAKKYDIGDLEDITVACSNEDQYEVSPFDVEATAEDIILSESDGAVEEPLENTEAPKPAVDTETEEADTF
ncbi:MAG: hypothetical protein ACI4HO_06025 [Ruminococcus sp.]